MIIDIESSAERTITIVTTIGELSSLYNALTRKKRTKADIEMLHTLADLIEAKEPNLLID